MPNQGSGVFITQAPDNTIGPVNLISGNRDHGISIGIRKELDGGIVTGGTGIVVAGNILDSFFDSGASLAGSGGITVNLLAGEEGFIARIKPYQFNLRPGKPQRLTVEVTNPFPDPAEAVVRLVTPPGWKVIPEQQTLLLQGSAEVAFTVQPPPDRRHGPLVRRLRLAADIIVAGRRFGQQAEALATIG